MPVNPKRGGLFGYSVPFEIVQDQVEWVVQMWDIKSPFMQSECKVGRMIFLSFRLRVLYIYFSNSNLKRYKRRIK